MIEVPQGLFFSVIEPLDVITRRLTDTHHHFEIRGGIDVGYKTPGYNPSLGTKRYFLTEQFVDKYAPHLRKV